jgi:hypothetical protein
MGGLKSAPTGIAINGNFLGAFCVRVISVRWRRGGLG